MTGVRDASLRAWTAARSELDECPWPGPVPLTNDPDRPRVLAGRDDDRVRFLQGVMNQEMSILSGTSGVGKSSLLDVGMVPDLKRAGFRVVLCRDWTGGSHGAADEFFLAEKVHEKLLRDEDLRSPTSDLRPGRDFFAELNELFGDELVLVLDQFEELIRYAPSQARASIGDLLSINADLDLRIVVSLRSEHLHELRALQQEVRPFSLFHLVLEPVVNEVFVREIVEEPNSRGVEVIEPDATEMLLAAWRSARTSSDDDAANIGLLHLQALLYSLWSQADGFVDRSVVETFAAGDTAGGSSKPDWAVFNKALETAIQVKLDCCSQAARAVGMDDYLIHGSTRALAQIVPQLSSAGFKIPRRIDDLAHAALADELSVLQPALAVAGSGPGIDEKVVGKPDGAPSDTQYHHLVQEIVALAMEEGGATDLCEAQREQLCGLADDAAGAQPELRWIDRLHPGAEPWVANLRGASCGPLQGMAPAHALVEEIRRFAFALAWLRASSLARITSPGSVGPMVALIHDGFGESLDRWAVEPVRSIAAALSAMTAPSGAVFEWPTEAGDYPDEFDGIEDPRVIPNLRWRGAWVETRFRKVIFANCDFRGTFFSFCTFDGVAFMNCLLDGAIFSDCTITGDWQIVEEPDVREPWVLDEPTFVIRTKDTTLPDAIANYRGCTSTGALYSPKPGLPATPSFDFLNPADLDPWAPEEDGLVIYGGRISSLVFRHCSEGQISLRHVAGSGLEIVEQRRGSLEITGSSLRHVTITTEVGEPEGQFKIQIKGSRVAQLWLGDNLTGSLSAIDSVLVQIFNGSKISAGVSPPRGNEAPSKVFQLVGFADDDVSVELVEDGDATDERTTAWVATLARQMDYRRDPALSEAREAASADQS